MPVLASHSSCMVWMLRAALPDFRAASSDCVVGGIVVVVGLDSALPFDEVIGLSVPAAAAAMAAAAAAVKGGG